MMNTHARNKTGLIWRAMVVLAAAAIAVSPQGLGAAEGRGEASNVLGIQHVIARMAGESGGPVDGSVGILAFQQLLTGTGGAERPAEVQQDTPSLWATQPLSRQQDRMLCASPARSLAAVLQTGQESRHAAVAPERPPRPLQLRARYLFRLTANAPPAR